MLSSAPGGPPQQRPRSFFQIKKKRHVMVLRGSNDSPARPLHPRFRRPASMSGAEHAPVLRPAVCAVLQGCGTAGSKYSQRAWVHIQSRGERSKLCGCVTCGFDDAAATIDPYGTSCAYLPSTGGALRHHDVLSQFTSRTCTLTWSLSTCRTRQPRTLRYAAPKLVTQPHQHVPWFVVEQKLSMFGWSVQKVAQPVETVLRRIAAWRAVV